MKLAKEFKHLAGSILHLPNEVRWNSWYRLIEEAIKARPSIVALIDAHPEVQAFQFTNDDWQQLKDTFYFLQPFNDATLQCEGRVSLDSLQDVMDMLSDHYYDQEAKHTSHTSMLAAINTSWIHFNEYYELLNQNPYYITAQLLHLAKRLNHLKKRWTKQWIREAERTSYCALV